MTQHIKRNARRVRIQDNFRNPVLENDDKGMQKCVPMKEDHWLTKLVGYFLYACILVSVVIGVINYL